MAETLSWREWLSQNKLRAVGGFWLASVGGSLAYQWTRPIPTSLKIIHTRVYAQAFTLTALALAGIVDVYEHKHATSRQLEEYRDRLHQLEAKFGHDSKQYEGQVHEIEARFGKETASQAIKGT